MSATYLRLPLFLIGLTACGLLACSARRTTVKPAFGLSSDKTWVDLQPGWRLKVVTPLLTSGGFRLKSLMVENKDPTSRNLVIKADDGFLGYEVSYYSVGVRKIEFSSVEAILDGKSHSRTKPTVMLFSQPSDARFTRLIFFIRASDADHDMAVLAAKRYEDLAPWTERVKAAPEATCNSTPYCSWIPAGIAVTVERPNGTGGCGPV